MRDASTVVDKWVPQIGRLQHLSQDACLLMSIAAGAGCELLHVQVTVHNTFICRYWRLILCLLHAIGTLHGTTAA